MCVCVVATLPHVLLDWTGPNMLLAAERDNWVPVGLFGVGKVGR